MFAGIYAMGAGLGPASAFLYSGPAINVLAVFLSSRVLGLDIGLARTIGAILFAVLIGLGMRMIFRRAEKRRTEVAIQTAETTGGRPLWQTALFFLGMILFLVFSDWYNTNEATVVMTDGTRIEANIRYDRRDTVDIQYEVFEALADGSTQVSTHTQVYQLVMNTIRILREELSDLARAGCEFVQFDEPVLTEVVFSEDCDRHTFM